MAMCQCPQSGDTHFYRQKEIIMGCLFIVSMPSIGRYSFLRPDRMFFTQRTLDVSMPLIGRYSFLQENPHRKSAFMNLVSMPLIGRFSFLRCRFVSVLCWCEVSMPLIGRFSFLLCFKPSRGIGKVVSMPLIGRFSFLPCLSGTGLFSRFPGSFLQVFFRIFW